MKKCKDCGLAKKQIDFYGVQGECKQCTRQRVLVNRKNNADYYNAFDKKRTRENFNRIFTLKYSTMLSRTLGRGVRKYRVKGMEICTREEFFSWCNTNIKPFKKLHRQWKKSEWKRNFAPSIDRIDNSKGYTTDNIRWLSNRENRKKGTV